MTAYLEATKAQTEYLCHAHVVGVGVALCDEVLVCGVQVSEARSCRCDRISKAW